MIARFADPERGGFFTTSSDHEQLIARRKDIDDHPIPSGSSSAAYGLLRLGALSGERSYVEQAESVFSLMARVAESHPQAVGHLIRAIDFHLSPVKEVALVSADGDGLGELAAIVRSENRPHLVLAGGAEGTETPGADAGPDRGRGPCRRLRLRELRLPDAGDRTGGAGGSPDLGSPDALVADRDRARAALAAGERVGGAARPRRLRRGAGRRTSAAGLVETWDGVPLDTTVTLPSEGADHLPLVALVHGFGNSKYEYLNPDETALHRQRLSSGRATATPSSPTRPAASGARAGRRRPRLANPVACASGYIHLADIRYEVRDTQELIGRLVDDGTADPARIGVTGDSYGGGQTLMLAALRDRVMLPDGSFAPWRSPAGAAASSSAPRRR